MSLYKEGRHQPPGNTTAPECASSFGIGQSQSAESQTLVEQDDPSHVSTSTP